MLLYAMDKIIEMVIGFMSKVSILFSPIMQLHQAKYPHSSIVRDAGITSHGIVMVLISVISCLLSVLSARVCLLTFSFCFMLFSVYGRFLVSSVEYVIDFLIILSHVKVTVDGVLD
jgi:hypothetical protein